MKKRSNINLKKNIVFILGLILFLSCTLVGCGKKNHSEVVEVPTEMEEIANCPMPWEISGSKQPSEYTWQEFETLTGPQQLAFQKTFASEEAFAEWMEESQVTVETVMPWEVSGAKLPRNYTWQEFQALNAEQQIAFQASFQPGEFDIWMEQVNPTEAEAPTESSEKPWEKPGAKQPNDYTLEEFNALSGEMQIAFQQHMGVDAFLAWMSEAVLLQAENPWDVPGAKSPEDYSWDEFEALSAAQQIAFQNYLGPDAFEEWISHINELS